MDSKKQEIISRDDFITHRDQVLTGLTTIMRNIQDFYQGFVNQTNSMIHGTDASIDSNALNSLMSNFPAMNASGKPRKVREKKVRDPNAPKKPLTAFFLFQQTARPIVSLDLGDKATPKEVADETQRRWTEMSEEEKQEWKDRYQVARTQYVRDFAEYQSKQAADVPTVGAHEDEEDDDVSHDLGLDQDPVAPHSDHEEEDGSDEQTEDDEEDEPEPPSPPPPPSSRVPKVSKKKANGVIPKSPSPSAQLVKQTPIPVPAEKKDTKRKRKDKDDAAPASTAVTEPSPKKTKKAAAAKTEPAEKKEPKRKRKSDA